MQSQPFAATSRELLRDTVLESLDALLIEQAWPKVPMGQIAKLAGVSRQTLYNVFGTREALIEAYVRWATDRLFDHIEVVVDASGGDLRLACFQGFEAFLTAGEDHPILRALRSSAGASELHAVVATPAGLSFLQASVERLVHIISTRWPMLDPKIIGSVSELFFRLSLSYATIPDPAVGPSEVLDQFTTVMAPTIQYLWEQTQVD